MTVDYNKIPNQFLVPGVRRYIETGLPFGSFLTALFDNNLKMAVFQADRENLVLLKDWLQWMHWEAPSDCHGSPAKTKAWRAKGGLEGKEAA